MRKNTARHWLHATLDLLPVVLIPVFMIYSHRHDLSTDITIQQDVYKDFYQGVKNGKPNSLEHWYSLGGTLQYDNGIFKGTGTSCDFYGAIENTKVLTNSKLYLSINFPYLEVNEITITLYYEKAEVSSLYSNEELNGILSLQVNDIYEISANTNYDELNIYTTGDYFEFNNIQLFNLTSIFGSGNEPTKEVFESYLTQDYYDYGSNQVKVGTTQVPVKNNDIMSVFMDSFNTSINKYFNMGNVFNMTSVYNWFNTNIFGGTAPVVIYSVWNIVLYEFVMDLLFLLYGLFMWFIDMCKRLMEKPLDSIK